MSGFVGSRARKKKRNIFLTLGILILLGIFIYILPKLGTDNSEIIPNDSIIPDPTKDLTSLEAILKSLN